MYASTINITPGFSVVVGTKGHGLYYISGIFKSFRQKQQLQLMPVCQKYAFVLGNRCMAHHGKKVSVVQQLIQAECNRSYLPLNSHVISSHVV